MTASSQPNYYVFFDVDGTLLHIKSTHSFLKFFYEKKYPIAGLGLIQYFTYIAKIKLFEKLNIKREFLNSLYYRNFKGVEQTRLQLWALGWFRSLLNQEKVFVQDSIAELQAHQKKGAAIVLVSGSFEDCLAPLAQFLKVDGVLATKLKAEDGICLGEIEGHQIIGLGKAQAISAYLKEKDFIQLDKCYAYGDHISDLAMLSLVGNGCVVGHDPGLKAYAEKNNWRILSQ